MKSINGTPDGRYVLFWDHPATSNDVAGITYEVYMDKWDSLPADPSAASALDPGMSEEGRVLGSRFMDLDDAKSPVSQGLLLSSVKGVRSYTLDQKIQPDVIYAFQVRASSNTCQRDKTKCNDSARTEGDYAGGAC